MVAYAQEVHPRTDSRAVDTSSPLLLNDNGLVFPLPRGGRTVGDALRAVSISWSDRDLLMPDAHVPLAAVDTIVALRERTVVVRVGTEEMRTLSTHRTTVDGILAETHIVLSTLDRTQPHRTAPIADGDTVTVTRVQEETRREDEQIPPPVEIRHDSTLALGAEEVADPGAPGRAELSVHIRTENGTEVARTVLRRTVTLEPRLRVVRRGTKIVVLSAETGRASWFPSSPGTAAHRSLPFGTRLRVVRTDTGASTIVRVGDRGPFLPGRIVDVSADVFRALAPLAAGTIPVRVERLP